MVGTTGPSGVPIAEDEARLLKYSEARERLLVAFRVTAHEEFMDHYSVTINGLSLGVFPDYDSADQARHHIVDGSARAVRDE